MHYGSFVFRYRLGSEDGPVLLGFACRGSSDHFIFIEQRELHATEQYLSNKFLSGFVEKKILSFCLQEITMLEVSHEK